MTKPIYLFLGWTSLALGVVGIFVPLLPTTPFAILSAFLFSKSSPRMHAWLLQNPVLGPPINDWHEHRVITLKSKLLATILIVPLFAYTLLYVSVATWIKILVAACGLGVLMFLWTQKSTRYTGLAHRTSGQAVAENGLSKD